MQRSAEQADQKQEAESKITELKRLIEDRENHSEDAERVADLKYSVLVKAREAGSEQESIRAELEEKINQESATVKECQDAKKKSEAARDSASKGYTEAALNASSLEDAERELGEYDSIFEQIVRICEKYSHESTAAFTGVLRDEIRRDIATTEADIATNWKDYLGAFAEAYV